jgi:hypothetical protein
MLGRTEGEKGESSTRREDCLTSSRVGLVKAQVVWTQDEFRAKTLVVRQLAVKASYFCGWNNLKKTIRACQHEIPLFAGENTPDDAAGTTWADSAEPLSDFVKTYTNFRLTFLSRV